MWREREKKRKEKREEGSRSNNNNLSLTFERESFLDGLTSGMEGKIRPPLDERIKKNEGETRARFSLLLLFFLGGA